MDFASIQADIAQFQFAHCLRHQQNLHKQIVQLWQKLLAEVGDTVMVRMHITANKSEGDHFVGRLLDLTRTENPGGISVK